MRYSLLLSVPLPKVPKAVEPRWNLSWLWFAILALLANCGGPKAPSPDDFRHALQVYFDARPVCLPVAFKLPADAAATDETTLAPLDALVAAGLARSHSVRQREVGAVSGSARIIDLKHYELSPAGEAVVRPGVDRFLGGSELCFAKKQIVAVASINPPIDQAVASRQARVTYRYRLVGLASWTDRSDVRTAIPGIPRLLSSSSGTATDTLILGDHGWLRSEQGLSR